MQNIEPAVIRTYLTVAETGSLTSAAKQIGKTTAAISYHIVALEAAVGQKLFIRHARGMALSEDGHQFMPRAQFLLKIYDQVINKKYFENKFLNRFLQQNTVLKQKRRRA